MVVALGFITPIPTKIQYNNFKIWEWYDYLKLINTYDKKCEGHIPILPQGWVQLGMWKPWVLQARWTTLESSYLPSQYSITNADRIA